MSLWMGYKSFIMDVGMYGNSFALDYGLYSILATDGTWFKNVWELLNEFRITASLGPEDKILPMRSGDRSLM